MNTHTRAIATQQPNHIRVSEAAALASFRRTHAPAATNDEFDSFIAYCSVKRLDPIKGDAILVVYGKGERRKSTIIVTQSGMRAMADRTGNYHPAKPGDTEITYTAYHLQRKALLDAATAIFNIQERTARIKEINDNMPIDQSNPFGLVEVRTVVYKNGIPAEGIARWQEFAPVTPSPQCFDLEPTGEYWNNNRDGSPGREKKRKVIKPGINPLDHLVLDTSGKWGSAGINQLHKCATVHALKAAFPDDYDHRCNTEETMDKTFAEERTASELAELGEQERRLNKIGQTSPELYAWANNNGDVLHYPPNAFGDAVLRSVRACKFRDEYDRLMERTPNKTTFNVFWAMHKNDALDVKTEFDNFKEKLPNRPEPVTIDHEGVPTNA